ncbi:MAG: DUF169 domain-containing protein [Promethearchaeia archaeon]
MSIREIGKNLKKAGKLKTNPLCIYGSEVIPNYSIPSTKIHFCIANAILSLSLRDDIDAIHYGKENKRDSCPGAQAWLGYESWNPFLHYFLSTGIKNIPSEFLVANPDLALKKIKSIGKITPIGKYTIISKCEIIEEDVDVKAIICFGEAEQIRNLSMLVYFNSEITFGGVQTHWGSSCSQFITYPAGLSENCPRNCAVLGPIDPTDNYFFPSNLLALAIPINIARSMSDNLEKSFIIKRAEVAFPSERVNPTQQFSKEDFKEFSKRLFGKH